MLAGFLFTEHDISTCPRANARTPTVVEVDHPEAYRVRILRLHPDNEESDPIGKADGFTNFLSRWPALTTVTAISYQSRASARVSGLFFSRCRRRDRLS